MESSGITGIPDRFWKRLELSKPIGDEWRVRDIAPELSGRLVGGINSVGHRTLLLALRNDEESLDDFRSRGLSVRTIALEEVPNHSTRYLIVECLDTNGHPLFDLIAVDLCNSLANSTPAAAVKRVLGKWRRFWGQVPRSMLTREEILGLIAELWFLRHWMIPAIGVSKSMDRWRGPLGARRDFQWFGHAVEVKASTIVNRSAYRISSIDQLDVGSEILWLFGLRLREDRTSTFNLPELISSCTSLMDSEPDSQMLFESLLSRLGYSRNFESEYRQMCFQILSSTLYEVNSDFPKLIPAMISNGVPAGVSEVRYTIDVSGFSGRSYSTPEAAADLLQ